MDMLILIKSNRNIINIEDCKTKTELFAYTIKSNLPNYNVTIQNCYQNIITTYDYIIFVNDSGFYNETNDYLKHIKSLSKYATLSFGMSNKFYTSEDIMFGLLKNVSNSKYIYIKPPLNEDLYIPRHDNLFYVFFDISVELYKITSICEKFKNINNVVICTINNSAINYYDIDLNLIQTINFNTYLDYINELSNGNLYFVTDITTDIYKLYELSMCNIKITSHPEFIPKNIVDELNIYTYTNINDLNWDMMYDLVQTHNIRDKLIMNDYSWTNAIFHINNELNKHIMLNNNFNDPQNINEKTVKVLNVNNRNKPTIVTKTNVVDDNKVMDKIYEILEIQEIKKPSTKRRVLLQSNLLQNK